MAHSAERESDSPASGATTPRSRKPVIAIVTDAIYPYHMGGKEVRYHHIIAGLAARNLEVHVFTMNWWHGPRHKVEDGVHYHAICRHYPLYTSTKRSILEAVMFSIGCWRLLTYRFDIIEADQMPHLQLFTIRTIAALRRVPLMTSWHEFWGRAYWREYMGPTGVIAAAIEQISLRCSGRIVTDSPDTADHLIGQGFPSDRIAVVPPGIDIDTIDATPAGAHYDLLCVGRLLEHKNVNLLIEAVGELRDRGDVRTCAIVGTGPERERLGDLVARLQLENEVTFLGNLEAATEIFALMKSASLLVLPSTREGFGMVVVEAMACGTPVITTNHPDNKARNLIDEGVNGWQCDPTTSALVQALIHASQAKLLGELLTAEERTGYSWDGRVTTIYNLVTAALSQAPHHV